MIITLSRIICFLLIIYASNSLAQLKFVVEDFEGMPAGMPITSKEGLFTYGSTLAFSVKDKTTGIGYSGSRCLKLKVNSGNSFAGWGKGVRSLVELDKNTDFFNFYYLLEGNEAQSIKLAIEEDDNNDGEFKENDDDSWIASFKLTPGAEWQLLSLPLSSFKDGNAKGDGEFNASYKGGRVLTINFRFENIVPGERSLYVDMLSFSEGSLKQPQEIIYNIADRSEDRYCLLGAWSEMGYDGDYSSIPYNFASHLGISNDQKLSVVHFFKPLAVDGNKTANLMPDIKAINRLVQNGYTPMLTLEIQYIGQKKQPDLKDIVDGKFDAFLLEYSQSLKNVQGLLLLRLFHEFNGDWYPWCIANNNKDVELFKKAFRHVRKIFLNSGNTNVKFVWCPNSKSLPQESWNYIVDAYPGNEFVDYVGSDVYNGSERGTSNWTSFRKENAENYYLFKKHFPDKPILICEISSRERVREEDGELLGKADWIKDLSHTVKTDMSSVLLLAWFDQYKKYKVNSSKESRDSFLENFWNNPYFKLSTNKVFPAPFKQ